MAWTPARLSSIVLSLCAALACGSAAQAQTWPTKPVRFVVPYPPGGSLDQVARALADRMKDGLGQPVLVENRPGAGGNVGADFVAKSAPDGYTIVMGAVATHATNPALYPKMPYDAIRDFQPITLVASTPNVLIVPPESPLRSPRELIDFARKNPGRLNFGSGSNGSTGHLAGELMKQMTGTFIVHIPYAGGNPALLGLMAGQTDLMFDNYANAAAQIKAGKVRALAVTTARRVAFAPELPTMAESDPRLAGFDLDTWFGILAPAGIPKDALERLHGETVRALASPELKERLARMGAVAGGNTPAQFAEFIAREMTKYARIVKLSGAKVD
ncbi:MAG: tripartite tricarboxylate transporter substrate binding protein [Burkholderiales bacterium]|nr:tripartite tricarboxylate transporter substrate binding protein [Burkholderiales bacterium]